MISISNLPMRKDALKDIFENYEYALNLLAEGESAAKNGMSEFDREKEMLFLNDYINNWVVQKSFQKSLQKVFDEEIGD